LSFEQREEPFALTERLIQGALALARSGQPGERFAKLVAIVAIGRLRRGQPLAVGKCMLERRRRLAILILVGKDDAEVRVGIDALQPPFLLGGI